MPYTDIHFIIALTLFQELWFNIKYWRYYFMEGMHIKQRDGYYL